MPFAEFLRWYRRESSQGRLSPAQCRAMLQRIVSRYETLGVDVRAAQAELGRLQAGGTPAPAIFPEEFEGQPALIARSRQ